MRQTTPGLTLAGIAALLLVACSGGGGGGSSSSSGGATNVVPVANAGPNQTVTTGTTVTLNGTGSTDSDGTIASYAWSQTAGTAVTISSATASQPTFTAPAASTLTFSLIVTDNRGGTSAASTVNITVNAAPNVVPTANAGANQTVTSGATVTLNGTASSDTDGSIASYAWTQIVGTAVTLSSTTASQPTFTAPTVATATTLTFALIVTDNVGAVSATSTVNVVVNPLVAGNVAVTGAVTFGRVLFATSGQDPNRGLYYQAPVQLPSRGVVVRARSAANQAILATGVTNDTGNYSLSVPGSTNITIELVARMLRDSSQPLPRWNIRVQNGDGTAGDVPYTYTDAVTFSSGAGASHNVAIPTGINASGAATGTRASAPFAILDTVYQGVQTILAAAPTTDFPELLIDWGNQSLGTFFSSASPQRIALLSSLVSDTDEFDQHVIAHEFGHYIEYNFSRADNIGGPHTLGEKLDPRVAFGEGFGYAFAAIVLGSTDSRDSANNNGDFYSTGFNIETNPQTSPIGAPGEDYGCWCSESSVYSILWDLYDGAADANDTVALGFAPLWSVLTGAQRDTPAYTTIFPFVTALKAARPGDVAAINVLLLAQNIDGTDAFGANETHFPPSVPSNAALPIYSTITRGGPSVVVRTVDDGGIDNKLGNHRFLRFPSSSTGQVTISLATTNPTNDPDFRMQRAGTFVAIEDDPPPGPETGTVSVTNGTTYVLDVYDCDNGCSNPQGTSGDYNLTITIN